MTIKRAAILLLVAAIFTLTGCYLESDDPTTGGNTGQGNQGLPFDTVAPTASPTPTAPPTAEPVVVGGSNISNINWDDDLDNQQTGVLPTGVVTMPPSGGSTLPGGSNVTASPAATRTASTSGSADSASSSLKAGAKGTEVSQVQQRLKDLKYYSGSVDGAFGAGTTAAVKLFQANNGLTADGVVGEKTKERLFSYYAVPYSGTASSATAKPSVTATPRPTATPNLSKARYLKLGMSGSDVRLVQNRLIDLGYLTGKADSTYGSATEAAVKAFQKRNGLWNDGIAGPDTQRKLYSNSAVKASSAAAHVGETLELGAQGASVRALQTRLIQLKYLSGSADGSFGEKTRTAVIAFQQNNGLTADGKAGAATLAKLFSEDAVNANGVSPTGTATSGSSSSSSTGYTVLQSGDKNDDVKKLQQKLKDLGYYQGTVDGSFGSGTETAVKAFQRDMALVADGKAGPATQRALYGTNASQENTSVTLELGSEGKAVTNLQYALYELGYYQDKITGVYSQNTHNAVREFQMNNGLTADGRAGKATQDMLYSPYARPVTVEKPKYVTVKLGDKGEDVVQVQSVLNTLGYSSRKATGEFDQDTHTALVAFQTKNGLTADGVAGPDTQAVLFSSGAKKAD